MDFLEKLNYLMEKNNLNKSSLSKACNIPYTTIDGWYKKGYEGLKLTTLRKLADYFGTTLDFWASDQEEIHLSESSDPLAHEIEKLYFALSDENKKYLYGYIQRLLEEQNS